ncbi:MAG: hypothetical protein M3460_27105 [Actinomycetota bacterium]|nr:hypothetical protein [Actinomycetota bacterium]
MKPQLGVLAELAGLAGFVTDLLHRWPSCRGGLTVGTLAVTLGGLLRPVVPPAVRARSRRRGGAVRAPRRAIPRGATASPPLVAVLLVGSWAAAVAAGLGFGLGRAAMALGRHHSRDATWWDQQWRRHQRCLRITLALVAALLAARTVLC